MIKKIALLLIFLFDISIFASDINLRKGHYSISYDALKLPANESMGLLGTSYLYDFDDSYFGLGIYSAVSGHRGGFFTGGIEAGTRYKLTNTINIDLGMFVGGGGGGSAPQGGGLMLRPHVGLAFDQDNYKVSLSATKVKFPNGNIDSNQLSLGLEIPFETIYKQNTDKKITAEDIKQFINLTGKDIGWSDHYFTVTAQKYLTPSGIKNTAGQNNLQDMSLVGFEYGTKLAGNKFYFFETAGASGGGADGYAQILGGIGYIKALSRNSGMVFKASIGAAGGGRVDTGGGIVHKQSLGVYYALSNRAAISSEVGHIAAIDGEFRSPTVKFGFNWATQFLSIGKNLRSTNGDISFDDNEWNIRLSNQTYLSDKSIRKNQTDDTPVDLIGFKIDRFISEDTYISGQALGAYEGKSGGYAVGLIGIGNRVEINNDWSVFGEFAIGASGGGSIDTGGGAIVQPSVGTEYKIYEDLGFQVSIGKIKALGGNLNTNVFDFGLNYKFKTIE